MLQIFRTSQNRVAPVALSGGIRQIAQRVDSWQWQTPQTLSKAVKSCATN
ncbi:MAG: hypothetical protein KME59_22815 [Trichormus sp. ATA11-4-KO1]|nr:hypothetical protein [Trichormus sp. ATA11-4-KO1]